MNPFRSDPRLRRLLTQADETARLLASMQEQGMPALDVEDDLDEVYRELGKLMHELAGAPEEDEEPDEFDDDPEFRLIPTTGTEIVGALDGEPPGFTDQWDPPADSEEEPEERWYTEDEQVVGQPRLEPLEERLPTVSARQPAPAPAIPPVEESEDTEDSGVAFTARLSRIPGAVPPPSRPVPALDDSGLPSWLTSLRDLVDAIAMPKDMEDASQLAVEAARVQWATSEMGAMWQEYPEPLQLALLGLLAARLRHLEERISLDVGPKMALERLRSYRVTLGLDSVPGLMPNRRPEYASWAVDAMHWWAALEDGLRPLLDGEVSQ